MVSNTIFTTIIILILAVILVVGFGLSLYFRTQKSPILFDIFLFVCTLILLVLSIIIVFFFQPDPSEVPAPQPVPGPAPGPAPGPGPVPQPTPGPMPQPTPGPTPQPTPTPQPAPIAPSPILTRFGNANLPKYYQYDPKTKNLKRLNFDKITDGKEIVDYFHKNDETLFVLSDGTIVSIFGDRIDKYPTNPPIEKIRVTKGNYVGLSDGSIYFSKNLKNWVRDNSYSNVLDFDVPSDQNNILYIQTPSENLIMDLNTNYLTREPSSKKQYGSNVTSFLRFTNDGIFINDQFLYKDARLGNIDNKDKNYIIPLNTQNKYKILDIYSADDKAILKLESDANTSEQFFIGDELIYR